MSNKPPKKSDLNKSWMQPRRDRRKSIAPEYHLIVAEGEETEPNYFEGLKNQINSKYPGRISMEIKGTGKNTKGLLQYAQNFAASSVNEYKHIWIVFDKDDFPPSDFDETCSACEKLSNENTVYHALWSNQCIEYWFLLHYIYLDTSLNRKDYISKLSDLMNRKYEKNQADIYTLLRPNLHTAIEKAKKISNGYADAKPSDCDPCTKVYEIFELLKKYL